MTEPHHANETLGAPTGGTLATSGNAVSTAVIETQEACVQPTTSVVANDKHKGVCPFCKEEMIPTIVEKSTFQRDRCQCSNPECRQIIYVCRFPGCCDYAKGGSSYAHELCPEHTHEASKFTAATVAGLVVGAVVKMVSDKD